LEIILGKIHAFGEVAICGKKLLFLPNPIGISYLSFNFQAAITAKN
jgi:hypothetical protein